MIELNSVYVVLMVEAMAALVLIILAFLMFSKKKSSNEQTAVYELIDKLEETENNKANKLRTLISDHCDMDPSTLTDVLSEIGEAERLLYKHISQLFLSKDAKLLQKIDQQIDDFSALYCKLLTQTSSSSSSVPSVDNSNLEREPDEAEGEFDKLRADNRRLSEQLTMAMETMDEISAEYMRVFNGTQTELELENSSKKMLKIFQYAEQQMKATYKDMEVDEL